MPRIVQLLHSDENGGVEMLAGLIGGNLQAAGAEVEILYLYPKFGSGTLAKIGGLLLALAKIFRVRPDVIVAFQPTASVLTGLAGWAIGCPNRIVHQTSKPSATHPLSRLLDRLVGCTRCYSVNIVNSQATLAEFDNYPRAYRANLRLIEHGFDPPEPRAARAETLNRFQIPDDGAILLNAGRLSAQKAQRLIIETLPLLPDARLVLAGGGPLENSYRDVARSHGVGSRVHFLGFLAREDVGDLLGAADVFVFPSAWETFGLAVVEAAMLGVPVVCSDLPVLRDVLSVQGRSIAAFVNCGDSLAVAEAIKRSLMPEVASQARAFAKGLRLRHSQDQMLDAYRSLIWPERMLLAAPNLSGNRKACDDGCDQSHDPTK